MYSDWLELLQNSVLKQFTEIYSPGYAGGFTERSEQTADFDNDLFFYPSKVFQ